VNLTLDEAVVNGSNIFHRGRPFLKGQGTGLRDSASTDNGNNNRSLPKVGTVKKG